jgi:hypothetical protein
MVAHSPVSVFKGKFERVNHKYKNIAALQIFNDWYMQVKYDIKYMIKTSKLPNISTSYEHFEAHDMHLIDKNKKQLTNTSRDVPITCYIYYKNTYNVNKFQYNFLISTCKNNDRNMMSYDERCTELSEKVIRCTEYEFIDHVIDIINYFKTEYKSNQLNIYTNNANEFVIKIGVYVVFIKFVSTFDTKTNQDTIYQSVSLYICYCHSEYLDNISELSKNKIWTKGKENNESHKTLTYLQMKNDMKTKDIPKNIIKCDLIVKARALGMKAFYKYNKEELAQQIRQFELKNNK